jgi:hypothetical protein
MLRYDAEIRLTCRQCDRIFRLPLTVGFSGLRWLFAMTDKIPR